MSLIADVFLNLRTQKNVVINGQKMSNKSPFKGAFQK